MRIEDYTTLSYLYKILSTKIISSVIIGEFLLFIFSPFIANIVILFLIALAIIFTFYMLFVLYTYEKKGWIIGFFIWMIVSFIPLWFLSGRNLLSIVFLFSPLLFFFFYCMALREKIGEWMIETEFMNNGRIENFEYESNRNKTRR